MSGYYQRNRDPGRGHYRGQSSGGGNYNRDSSYQRQGNMNMGRQQMVNPWQSGMMPSVGVGGGMQAGGVAGADEAALAFNILNQVLASDTPMMSTGQRQGGGRFQDRKPSQMGLGNRLQDRRRAQSPQFSGRNRSDRDSRQLSGRSRSPHGRDNRSNSSRRDGSDRNKRPMNERLGRPNDKKKFSEFKRSQSKEHTSGDKRKKSVESDDVSKARQRESSKDKDLDGDCESKGVNEKEKGKRQKDNENDEQVIKGLKCHICEVDSFDSIESFRTHKRSAEHKQMANIYNSRSEAVIQLMRADAKLAANRDREKAGNANRETLSNRCIKCDCTVADAFKSHKKSIEHELVDNYMTRECCGSSFTRRREFEDHRLTIPHLKRQMEAQKENNEPEKKVVLAFTDEEVAAANVLRELKDVHRMELESAADFPAYDESKPIGLGYVHKKRRFNCTVCKKEFPSYNTMAVAHCRSFNHYLMLSAHLEKDLKEVEDEETFETEDIKDAKDGGAEDKEELEKKKEGTPVADNSETAVKEEEEEETEEAKDEKEEEMENDNENVDGDEEMGENLPPLEDGGIILEDEDKAAEDEGETGFEEVGEDFENEATRDGDDKSSDEQDKEPLEEGIPDEPETEDKVIEEVKAEEEANADEMPDEAKEVEEEEEDEEEVEVKPKATRGRRGRGRGRGAKRQS